MCLLCFLRQIILSRFGLKLCLDHDQIESVCIFQVPWDDQCSDLAIKCVQYKQAKMNWNYEKNLIHENTFGCWIDMLLISQSDGLHPAEWCCHHYFIPAQWLSMCFWSVKNRKILASCNWDKSVVVFFQTAERQCKAGSLEREAQRKIFQSLLIKSTLRQKKVYLHFLA